MPPLKPTPGRSPPLVTAGAAPSRPSWVGEGGIMPRENLGESPPNGAGRRHPEQHRPPLDVPSAALTDHRLAELVPEMAPDEYGALVADIAAHGLLEPIVTFEGRILDGRHRYRGCLATETEPRFKPYEGEDPLDFVISENVKRRHLTPGQLAFITLNALPLYEAEAEKRMLTGKAPEQKDRKSTRLNSSH